MKIGFIGTGNMGRAMIEGIISSGFCTPEEMAVYDIDSTKLRGLKEKYNISFSENEVEVVRKSFITVLAVKPDVYVNVLEKIKDDTDRDKIIMTIAPGMTIEDIENIIGSNSKIVRTMPNTPAQVQEGMTAMVFNHNIKEDEKRLVKKMLDSFGKSIEIDEKLMAAYVGIAGSLPAYVYMFMEALADGGVLSGMPRGIAYEIIAQTVKGSAEMLLQTGRHPGKLKDEVTSPSGTTIEAVRVLEKGGFRGVVIEAVAACSRKAGSN